MQIPNSAFRIPNPAFRIPNPAFRIPNPAFRFPNSESRFPLSSLFLFLFVEQFNLFVRLDFVWTRRELLDA
jgi:hypothetical protein